MSAPPGDDIVAKTVRGAFAPKSREQAKALAACSNELWPLLVDPGIAATNNIAARRLRRPVILRKLSFGLQSRRGSRYVERALSTTVTLREQRRPVLPFLVDALHAHLAHDKAPSLLPVIG